MLLCAGHFCAAADTFHPLKEVRILYCRGRNCSYCFHLGKKTVLKRVSLLHFFFYEKSFPTNGEDR